jgi:hypothetical protein
MWLVSIAQNSHSNSGTKNLFSWKSKNVEDISAGENRYITHIPKVLPFENLKFLQIKYTGITPLNTKIA